MAEVKSAIPLEEIQRVVNEIVEKFKPQRVILFGSQAKGEAKEESDLDLLIVMDFDNPSRLEMAHLIRSSIEAPKQDWMGHKVCAWLDIHVYSPSEFEASLLRKGVFLTTVAREGIVLYEASDAKPLDELLSQAVGWEGEGMKPETKEWIEKAEGDWRVACYLRQAPMPDWDNICFHAQQCAEKYIKAYLEERGIIFPKTHNLVRLLDLCSGELSELGQLRSELENLSRYAVIPRYIGFHASQSDAEEALRVAGKVRSILREKLEVS